MIRILYQKLWWKFALIHGKIIKKQLFCSSKWAILLNSVKFPEKNQYFRQKGGFLSFRQKQNPLERSYDKRQFSGPSCHLVTTDINIWKVRSVAAAHFHHTTRQLLHTKYNCTDRCAWLTSNCKPTCYYSRKLLVHLLIHMKTTWIQVSRHPPS